MKELLNENKELLLKDICAKLPYGVYCQIVYKRKNKVIEECKQLDGVFFSESECLFRSESGAEYSADYKPYLRKMSSMTEDEKKEYDATCADFYETLETYDWLNKKMFDYRGLIEKGLALEAQEGMYK